MNRTLTSRLHVINKPLKSVTSLKNRLCCRRVTIKTPLVLSEASHCSRLQLTTCARSSARLPVASTQQAPARPASALPSFCRASRSASPTQCVAMLKATLQTKRPSTWMVRGSLRLMRCFLRDLLQCHSFNTDDLNLAYHSVLPLEVRGANQRRMRLLSSKQNSTLPSVCVGFDIIN